MGTLRIPTTARTVLRSNPRRRLRADARVHVEAYVIPEPKKPWPKPEHGKPGVYWVEATFFDPEVDRDPRELSEDDFWDDEMYKAYQRMGMGGVKAWWPSEAAWASGEPGRVEYIAAGNGFGPDILEGAAELVQRPLVLGKGWNPAIELFKRYGGTAVPRQVSRFQPVRRPDSRVGPGEFAVKTSASDAYNSGLLSSGILPRYQMDGDRFSEDPAKLAADEQR
jgi:hypothetical protein